MKKLTKNQKTFKTLNKLFCGYFIWKRLWNHVLNVTEMCGIFWPTLIALAATIISAMLATTSKNSIWFYLGSL